MYRTLSGWLILALCASASGCVVAQFAKPTTDFQKSAATTTAAIGTYYRSRNAFERELYFFDLAADPSREVGAVAANGQRTPLLGQFDPKAIQARLDSLDLINVYATRLADLAGSEQPAKFADSAEVLGKNLSDLGKTWQDVAHVNSDATKYVGPITALVGVVGEMILEAQRDAAVKKAILEGDPLVRKLLGFLRDDLADLSRLEETGIKQELAGGVGAYNDHRAKMTPAERAAALDAIGAVATRYEATVDANPVELVNAMLGAETALVKFAQSSRHPKDFAEMTSALEAFAARAQRVADAFGQLLNINKGGNS